MNRKQFNLKWPLGGLNRSADYNQLPPYSTPDCLNVRAFGTFENRARGGSRPGLMKHSYFDFASQVRMMQSVTHVETDSIPSLVWSDDFNGHTLSGVWSHAIWLPSTLNLADESYTASDSDPNGGVVRDLLSDADYTKSHIIEMLIIPTNGGYNGKFSIFGQMDDTLPQANQDGFIATMVMEDGTGVYNGTLDVYTGGIATSYTFDNVTAPIQPGWFRIVINGTDLNATWQGVQLHTTITLPAAVGNRVGLGIECTVSDSVCMVDQFRVQYDKTISALHQVKTLLVSADNKLFRSTTDGDFEQIASTLDLADNGFIDSVEHTQQIIIADTEEPRITVTSGVVAADGVTLTSGSVTDWTTYGINPLTDVVVITDASTDVTGGVYTIASVAAGNVVLNSSSSTGVGTATLRIQRAPKIYDPATNTLTLLESEAYVAGETGTEGTKKGSFPIGCSIVSLHNNRAVWAGSDIAPHLWFMSRQGDINDYDYAQTDDQRAIAGGATNTGGIGDAITAIASHSSDYLVFGCTNSMWLLRGDPLYGGALDNITNEVGIISNTAWCQTPQKKLIFLSNDGLYSYTPGSSSVPTSISREKIPEEMLNINMDNYEVHLQYDMAERGVHIYRTSKNPVIAGSTYHFFLDLTTESFWPMTMPADFEPTTVFSYNNELLIGGRDGAIRIYKEEASQDEEYVIDSHIMLGPSLLGRGMHNGTLDEMTGVVALGSDSVTWELSSAESHQSAATATARATGSFIAGANRKARPRISGHAFALKIKSIGKWSMEQIKCVRTIRGKQRL